MSERDSVLRYVKDALSADNARAFDGDNNFRKSVNITTCVVGADKTGTPVFVFEAKIPRSAVNELGCSSSWTTNSREEALAFLSDLALEIQKGS